MKKRDTRFSILCNRKQAVIALRPDAAQVASHGKTGQENSKSGPYRIRTYGLLIRSQPL
jgi:hypothetical protein